MVCRNYHKILGGQFFVNSDLVYKYKRLTLDSKLKPQHGTQKTNSK